MPAKIMGVQFWALPSANVMAAGTTIAKTGIAMIKPAMMPITARRIAIKMIVPRLARNTTQPRLIAGRTRRSSRTMAFSAWRTTMPTTNSTGMSRQIQPRKSGTIPKRPILAESFPWLAEIAKAASAAINAASAISTGIATIKDQPFRASLCLKGAADQANSADGAQNNRDRPNQQDNDASDNNECYQILLNDLQDSHCLRRELASAAIVSTPAA